jgi:hypothetical protein
VEATALLAGDPRPVEPVRDLAIGHGPGRWHHPALQGVGTPARRSRSRHGHRQRGPPPTQPMSGQPARRPGQGRAPTASWLPPSRQCPTGSTGTTFRRMGGGDGFSSRPPVHLLDLGVGSTCSGTGGLYNFLSPPAAPKLSQAATYKLPAVSLRGGDRKTESFKGSREPLIPAVSPRKKTIKPPGRQLKQPPRRFQDNRSVTLVVGGSTTADTVANIQHAEQGKPRPSRPERGETCCRPATGFQAASVGPLCLALKPIATGTKPRAM